MVEKRYRMNLIDKIAKLRDSIPGLRSIDNNLPDEDSQSPATAPKLNKVCLYVFGAFCTLANKLN